MGVVIRLDHGAGRISLPLNRRDHVRDRIAAEIERLVDMLDALDGDADAEPDLGWPEGDIFPGNEEIYHRVKFGVGQNRHRDEYDRSEIGIRCRYGADDDREDDAGDDREPDEDREPILGWTDAADQAGDDRFGEPWRHDEEEVSCQPPVTRSAKMEVVP